MEQWKALRERLHGDAMALVVGNLNLVGDVLESPVWKFWVGHQNLSAPAADNPVTFAKLRSLLPAALPGYDRFHACVRDAWADLHPVWQTPQSMLHRCAPHPRTLGR